MLKKVFIAWLIWEVGGAVIGAAVAIPLAIKYTPGDLTVQNFTLQKFGEILRNAKEGIGR